MQTPAGKECRYFYGDYFRGRSIEECRLLQTTSPEIEWKSEYCNSCPVPEILLANACTHMVLEPSLTRSIPFGKKRVKVKSYCTKTLREDFDPHIGCGECHILPDVFTEETK
jgi:hypothetical protein